MLASAGVLALLAGGGLWLLGADSNRYELNFGYGLTMWRKEPLDRLFPDSLGRNDRGLGYDGDGGESLDSPQNASWRRVGISPEKSCDKSLTSEIRRTARELDCQAVLRATYIDPTGNIVVTIALVVFPEGGGKSELADYYTVKKDREAAVMPYAAPGTPAAKWTKDRRNGADVKAAVGQHLPYAFAATAGAADLRSPGSKRGARIPSP
ncbi:hypothetical protein ACFQVC_31270 [Streptomyces monticola]|uniref:Uncharacterized protein n=1 Tax=Streptomyces monticola TaxID=2666263 RepID=A0ABW2JR98_9ACTN